MNWKNPAAPIYYRLDDQHQPVAVTDILEWGRWFETADRHVADTRLDDGVRISTVFLGIDHQFGDGPPILFETLIFGGPHDQEMFRYATWAQANAGHTEVVRAIIESRNPNPADGV